MCKVWFETVSSFPNGNSCHYLTHAHAYTKKKSESRLTKFALIQMMMADVKQKEARERYSIINICLHTFNMIGFHSSANLNNCLRLYVCLSFRTYVCHTFRISVASQSVTNKSFLVCVKGEKYALKKILESPPGILGPQAPPEGLDSARAAGTF